MFNQFIFLLYYSIFIYYYIFHIFFSIFSLKILKYLFFIFLNIYYSIFFIVKFEKLYSVLIMNLFLINLKKLEYHLRWFFCFLQWNKIYFISCINLLSQLFFYIFIIHKSSNIGVSFDLLLFYIKIGDRKYMENANITFINLLILN